MRWVLGKEWGDEGMMRGCWVGNGAGSRVVRWVLGRELCMVRVLRRGKGQGRRGHSAVSAGLCSLEARGEASWEA